MWKPVRPLTNCAVTRTLCSALRTLPSKTAATFSLCATVAMSGCSPWNEKEEVRAATWSSLIRESAFSTSSVSPSEKYSCSLSPLMFTNGSTAIECGGGIKGAGAAVPTTARVGMTAFDAQRLSIARYVRAPTTAITVQVSSVRGDHQDGACWPVGRAVADDPDVMSFGMSGDRR